MTLETIRLKTGRIDYERLKLHIAQEAELIKEEFWELLMAGLGGGEYIEIRSKDAAGRWRQDWVNSDGAALRTVEGLSSTHDVYFGVVPRRGKYGDEKHAGKVVWLYSDVDAKCYEGGKGEAREALNNLALPPSIVIDSGNGYHAYWILKQPLDAESSGGDAKTAMACQLPHSTTRLPNYNLADAPTPSDRGGCDDERRTPYRPRG